MRSLFFRLSDRHRDEELIAALWEHGTSGIIEEDSGVRAFFADQDLTALRQQWHQELVEERHESPSPSSSPQTADWEGVCLGDRFFIAPPWVTDPSPDGRIRITLDSGTAFGTGRHETTQMMVERLEKLVCGGETVIDIGCGTGILSEVCRLLGAGEVVGCDIDPLAASAAASNFANPVFTGSADSIATECADILLVNISARVIDLLAAELKRIAKPNAAVLLAGFVAQSPPASFKAEHEIERNEWLCWTGSRNCFEPLGAPSPLIHSKQWW